ncbi:MAG: DNA alkylation repair protein [Deltaproteobacteria bacterium]|nr:DNA alkylation repair protein [Deltaproteobacteria bacterium]
MLTLKQKKAALDEVHAALAKASRSAPTNPERIKKYMNSQLSFFGLSVPLQRKVHGAGFSFLDESPSAVLETWDYIWNTSDNFEVMTQPLFYYGHPSRATLLPSAWPVISKWSTRIENWAHSDGLSSIYVKIIESNPARIWPTLQRWNKSKLPWLRRQSIVSIHYYSSARKSVQPFEKAIPLVKNLLHDEHYYVQKGVGWTLRELSNVHAEKTKNFLTQHAALISPAAFSAAIEKLSDREKAALKKLRSLRRSR